MKHSKQFSRTPLQQLQKFETTASGIDITGHTETDTLRVSGVSTFKDDLVIDSGINTVPTRLSINRSPM